ncbi:MAG TPA: hypothetical protein PKA10_13945 [Selenomonadales bacterium]|nr:hypothetical protein [Selenomonadales bacterium]
MNKKFKIALIFILGIVIISGYFLWQINRHEKAMLGQEWLIPVPPNVWSKYLADREKYPKVLASYKNNNPELLVLLEHYRKVSQNKATSLVDSIYYSISSSPIDFFVPNNVQMQFKREHPKEYETWNAIVYDLRSYDYPSPIPQNPPKPVIQQSINNYYRLLVATDAILVLGLIVTMLIYKEPMKDEEKTTRDQ